jgi:hypothetical protein
VVADVLFEVPPFLGALEVSCFLDGFLLVSVAAVLAGGFWANVKGMVANARAIASTVVFILVLSLAGLSARSQLNLDLDGENLR